MQGIRANDIVASIAQQASIPGHAIGAIRIQDHYTLLDVPEPLVAKVLAKPGPYQIRQRAVTISAPHGVSSPSDRSKPFLSVEDDGEPLSYTV